MPYLHSMNRTIVTFLFFLIGSLNIASAQSESGKTIPGATISILNTNYTIIADANGRFGLPAHLRPGSYILEVSATGYATTTRTIQNPLNSQLDIPLTPSSKQLDEVVVTAEKRQELLQKVPASITALSSRQVTDYRLWNSHDITAIVPDLYSADPGDGRTNQPAQDLRRGQHRQLRPPALLRRLPRPPHPE
jgi:hypothetical protein